MDFVTPQGLYEFKVMPFGLTNVPAVFQRLMQRVLQGINSVSGPDFISGYIDNMLVFSATLEEHLEHLCQVITRLKEVVLKLQPAKCCFVRKEVRYLGHVITLKGLKPDVRLVEAVKGLPTPINLHDVHHFLGLVVYYQKFIPRFAKIYQLTCKGATLLRSEECHSAFMTLKKKLSEPPILAYPAINKDFTLETDASILGLGAVLS